ncbi:MAG: cell division ATPase MinD [Candidatus Nanoarchaeia archaeon]|jgi:septum site-determining protein MinD|nr:cell division ATPase MinD [Candidatus Nanoarchaeia archaeon]MDD3993847.1 cell division ATPase MinD [Candidatus Nanoarchaeia archaeon]MDD4563641.1 cell division ATPase MinD [Candidatus Nanoarchaeia archaeon]
MARIIVITSGKGGVGKTTTAINLGASLNKLNKQTVIVDANLNTPNIGIHLGAPIVPITLNHVLKGKAQIEDAIYEHYSGTKIIPSSLSVKELTKFNTKKIPEIAQILKEKYDFVIFDSAAGFGEEVMAVIEASEEIIIVTNPEMPAVTDALKAVKVAREKNKNVTGVIITRHKNARYEMPLSSIKSMLETPIIGVIPEDKSVKEALTKRDAVIHTHPRNKVSKKYIEIAQKILGEVPEEKQGFWRGIFK